MGCGSVRGWVCGVWVCEGVGMWGVGLWRSGSLRVWVYEGVSL